MSELSEIERLISIRIIQEDVETICSLEKIFDFSNVKLEKL